MNILIVDDDIHIRNLLRTLVSSLGYTIFQAESAEAAWPILKTEHIHIVISDWMMPGEDGVTFCRNIRKHSFTHYIYVLLLTSKQEKKDIVEGMNAGADDFMIKPFDQRELLVRLRAGERIVNLERDLAEKNDKIIEANKKIEESYLRMKNDLEAAARFQIKLLPESSDSIPGNIQFDWLFFPSDFVAGDLFNYYQVDENHTGFYLLDVSGHGVTAAMLSFMLNKELAPNHTHGSLIYKYNERNETTGIQNPSRILSLLNDRYYSDSDEFHFFTIFYALYNHKNRKLTYVSAGHPGPILIRNNKNSPEQLEVEGAAIGIFENPEFNERTIELNPGDKLYLFSDGITECSNARDEEFGEKKLLNLLAASAGTDLSESLHNIRSELINWNEGQSFRDDISMLGIEFN